MTTVNQPDFCPKHNTPAKQSYIFGKCQDAEVIVYKGCSCATCFENNGFNDDGILYDSYNEAASKAKMIVAQAKVW